MNLIDLHVHSNASDGSLTPSEVVTRAESLGLCAIALTDHDTVDGIPEALQAAEPLSVEVIPGIELSCHWGGREIHMLGFYIDYQSPALLDFLSSVLRKRTERNTEMLLAFQEAGFSLTMEELLMGNPKTVITRAHFARALLNRGYVKSIDQAFQKYLDVDKPFYRRREEILPETAISIIRKAGGLAALAHPCLYKFGWEKTDALLTELSGYGLGGLECFHSSNNSNESGKLYRLAGRHGLVPTGGSDFHGAAKKDIELGKGRGNLRISASYLDDLRLAMFLKKF